MAVLWGIHNNEKSLDLVDGGFISIGWEELGDLSQIQINREDLSLDPPTRLR